MSKQRQAPRNGTANAERRHFLARAPLFAAGTLALPAVTAYAAGEDARNARYAIDKSISSPNQDSRVRTLVLHYTAQSLARSVALLTDPARPVSTHYLVPDAADDGKRFGVYELVPESGRAWHAGVSYWQGERLLNASSIGIEIVNIGFPEDDEHIPLMKRRWSPYPSAQIVVIGELAADIVARHQIPPHRVVGHADITPGRKVDPGPRFPWKVLYEQYGVGAWPDAEAVEYYRNRRPFDWNFSELQAKLLAYGYDTPQSGIFDAQTKDVVTAFQMHFRPTQYDGFPDTETVAILDALLEKYFGRDNPRLRDTMAPEPKSGDHPLAGNSQDAGPAA
ncbi:MULTISPECIES: N-acetylmuramoyl-L-alanine amidase [Burkholderia]|uniref:N-acetylmuramoyl-L-alanine amidase n=1 Tax=Burkholderia TaxID=32008 RepID=UPI0007525270|nr:MULTISPECIES: N-acetylmuramoyl-L-alanine amidase [Burkholderia]AOJ73462.1 N-acetylmuramoyl-L-alanine amidase [Burkholderia savannae]KVG41396.1 N-acetylmuramoyl-L-alanine amidase [Burkholderia sp. MSMB0265]KVG87915.1 N-acetylmuramoyl-L-alanine amidase [Burkholderia sp. MSMB2040]KVG96486.1 N-acetylmuramoyl-L-alanine amidase [Burkholderia sp. MSMB2041]KVH01633.1 N-acetylmuramoyl-L-alanine amidase [Burkholderia sp. MSMB2042]